MISTLKCIECNKTYNIKEIRYTCDCGSLLEVSNDLEYLKKLYSSSQWKELFQNRWKTHEYPFLSGVWRYKELILPDMPLRSIVSKPEGNTNLYRNRKLSKFFNIENLYFKHEGENPTLSFKDRGMTAGVSWANYLNVKAVACASTGDTSAAMAGYTAELENMKGIVFLPKDKISYEQLAQPIAYGCLTLALETDFDGCMKLVQEVCTKNNIYLLNSMNSFRIEGQKAIGMETLQQLDWKVPDWFVIPVGNAGNISALGKGLQELYALGIIDKLPKIAGIQVHGSEPFYLSYKQEFKEKITVTAQPTSASAIRIGNPVSYEKAKRVIDKFNGVVESVTEEELLNVKAVVDAAGISICPNSATAVAGMQKLYEKGIIKSTDTVVVILTAHGLKFSHTIIEYHQNKIPYVTSKYTNMPVNLPADYYKIKEFLNGIIT